MADYYSILEKTISGLPNNTPEVRNAVYKKARTAIETQLRNMNPVPSEDAINSQLNLLEEAIVLIDSEYMIAPDPLPVLEEEPPQAELPPEPSDEPLVPEAPASPAVSEPIPAAQEPVDVAPVTQSAVDTVETAIDRVQAEMPAEVGISETVEAAPTAASSVSAPTASADEVTSVSVEPTTKDILEPIVAADTGNVAQQEFEMDEEKSGGFVGGLIKLLVILGLLGGAGYAVWKNKDELTSFASNLMSPSPVVEEETAPEPEPVTTEPEVAVTQPEPEVVEPQAPEPVEPEVAEPVIPEPEVVQPEIIEPEVVEPETTQEVVQEETPTTSQQSGVIPIGEVAYLYEEGSAGSGATRTNAAITWELRQESLNAGSPPESVIVGKMDIPEKNASIDIVLKRNIDAAVSASHMIEVQFNLPPNFQGKSVESIARFVMKATEEAPGEPLAAVPVKVSEGNFLIALDNLQQAVTLNTQLLQNSSWIDVPIVYGTGKRALLTLEKGGTGERVFTEAFKDWQNR